MTLLNVEALHLEPGDLVVGRAPVGASADQCVAIARELEALLPGHRAVVLGPGWELERASREDLEELLKSKAASAPKGPTG